MESTFELLNGVEALFEHMPRSLFFVKDREGRYLAANDEVVRLFGAANEAEVIRANQRISVWMESVSKDQTDTSPRKREMRIPQLSPMGLGLTD